MSDKELRYKRCAHVEAGSGERCELDVTHTGQHEGATLTWADVAVDADGEPIRPPLGDTPADALLMIDNFPRRNRVDLWTRAEKAIQDAVDVCETTLPADPLETYSIILLAEARAKVAQLVDREIRAGRMAMPTGPTSTPVSEGTPGPDTWPARLFKNDSHAYELDEVRRIAHENERLDIPDAVVRRWTQTVSCLELQIEMLKLRATPAPDATPEAQCGKSAASFIPRLGQSFACVLTAGHNGECAPGGVCFEHGPFIGKPGTTPRCPKCPVPSQFTNAECGNSAPSTDAGAGATPPGGMNTPWPSRDVVRQLADAAAHLMRDHNCDHHGWELVDQALNVARSFLAGVDRPTCNDCQREISFAVDGFTHCRRCTYTRNLEHELSALHLQHTEQAAKIDRLTAIAEVRARFVSAVRRAFNEPTGVISGMHINIGTAIRELNEASARLASPDDPKIIQSDAARSSPSGGEPV